MAKYKKSNKRAEQEEDTRKHLIDQKTSMFKSSLRSLIVGGVCLVLSFLFNGNMIEIDVDTGSAIDVLLILMKALFITLFYTFTLVGLANTMELRGKPASFREVIIIGVMAIIQGVLNIPVLLISLLGIILATLYLWGIQVKVERY